ncbi:MAG: hypothetical protein ABSB33_02900 [Tepidisphaeraceae bacterium]|jgi:hypothetical protein
MRRILFGTIVVGLFLLSPARGQDRSNNPPPTTQPQTVSRQEFQQLQKDNAEMKQELADVKKAQADQAAAADQDAQDNDKQMKAVQDQVNKIHPGLESFVLAGDAAFGFQTQRGTDSTFFADVSPLILWQPVDSHILIESAFDLGIGGADINSETSTLSVNLADISYEVCDYFIIGAGLFAVPFGQYHNHFDPPWINKFPDDPLAFDAIAPISEVGAFAKGVIPSGTTRWTYDLYVANGPNLITDDPNAAGQLNFNDYTDLNNNKAIGGRLGFLPFPDMEMGYSLQYSKPNPDGFSNVYAFMQAADFHYKPLIKAISGQLDFSGEWIWSNVSPTTYDPTGILNFGPITFGSFSQGGYFSLCYRPTELNNKILRNVELCSRYDSLDTPLSAPGGEHESRWTLGIDYWVTSYCVVKTAYEIDQKKVGENQNAFILQVGIGL